MSKAIIAFLKRLSTDLAFRDLAVKQPETALASYNLSTAERTAMRDLLRNDAKFTGRNGVWM